MEPQSESAADRAWEILAIASASALTTTVSVGLALGRIIPGDVPPVVSIVLSTAVLALNAVAIQSVYAVRTAGPVERLAACGAGFIGPCLTGFAWSGGHWLLCLWMAVLLLGGLAASVWWVRHTGAVVPTSSSSSSVSAPQVASKIWDRNDASRAPDVGSATHALDRFDSAAEPAAAHSLLQRVERRRDAGRETIDIQWQVEFAVGESSRSLHLPIAPPLSAAPRVECEPLDDGEVEITVGACYAYGVRLDVRRTGDATAASRSIIGVSLQADESPAAA